jgi:lipid II:glycine glycyltransferase (peptidoglycan interpeptide bridge formation enzyme)
LPRTAHVLDLSGGYDDVWRNKFRPRTRNIIRNAESSELRVESGQELGLVSIFYRLLEASFERWAKQQHEPASLARWRGRRRDPMEKFQSMVDAMRGRCTFWVAYLQKEPVAAILVLQDKNAHYTRAAMNEALAGKTSANYLLHSLAIKSACDAGCPSYQMGETGGSASLAQFKTRFGAVAVPYSELLFERLPLHGMQSSAKRLLKRTIGFRDVPLANARDPAGNHHHAGGS